MGRKATNQQHFGGALFLYQTYLSIAKPSSRRAPCGTTWRFFGHGRSGAVPSDHDHIPRREGLRPGCCQLGAELWHAMASNWSDQLGWFFATDFCPPLDFAQGSRDRFCAPNKGLAHPWSFQLPFYWLQARGSRGAMVHHPSFLW